MLAQAKADLHQIMRDDPGALFERIAEENSVTCREVVEALPPAMRRIAPGDAFMAAMNDIAEWGDVTFIIHTTDGIFEIGGPVPKGTEGRGYFNLAGSAGLHGHLRHDRCGGIAFVERPFMGKNSTSVLFMNRDGGFMFKVFVGRDEKRELKADQLARFNALADALGAA
ncbi:MAG: heme utilization cystosolic carrier protein HutX [Rhizobiales bacterium]|nr:heme utilization cystosolic carrier protein HutX [Hyphomicrobiales bacterium]